MRSGFPSSSSHLPGNVVRIGCWGGLAGVVTCRLQRAISTPITINPKMAAVTPNPIRIGDILMKNPASSATKTPFTYLFMLNQRPINYIVTISNSFASLMGFT